jgi:hypothetical protein
LQKIYKLLKPDGYIYLSFQSGKSEELYAETLFKSDEKLFINVVSVEEIKKLLNDSEFKIIHQYERVPRENEIDFVKLYIIAQKL